MKKLSLTTSARWSLCAVALLTGVAVQAQSQPRHDGQMPLEQPRATGQMTHSQPMHQQGQPSSMAPRHDGQMPIGTPRPDAPAHTPTYQPPMQAQPAHQGQPSTTAPRHDGQMPMGTPRMEGQERQPHMQQPAHQGQMQQRQMHQGQMHQGQMHQGQMHQGQMPQSQTRPAQVPTRTQGQLTQYEQNALRRCGIFKTEADRHACVGRVLEPQISGSVQGGGVLRSYTEQVLVPAR